MLRPSTRLVRLGEWDVPADPSRDLRGRTVVDSEGQDVGWIEEIYVDATDGTARLLVIEDAGLLGLGPIRFLLPFEAITQVQPYTVRVSQSSGRIAGAPRCDPDRVDAAVHASLCRHYGYQPAPSDKAGTSPAAPLP